MTHITLFDALELSLQALDQGQDIESCLVRFPELADELRPILTAAVQSRSMAVREVPEDVAQRGKARVLQAAAKLREQQRSAVSPVLPVSRKKNFWGARTFRLAFTALMVVIFLLTGGTNLVNASSGALPGDRLYPVKRSWEGVRLLLVLDKHEKQKLEDEFDHERREEIEGLYSEKRIAEVNFQGVVQSQNGEIWVIGGLRVKVEEDTYIGNDQILPGATVQVLGKTDDGIIEAEQVILLALPGQTPSPTPNPSTTLAPSRTPAAAQFTDQSAEDVESDETEINSTPDEQQGESDDGVEATRTPGSRDDGSDSNDESSDNPAPTSDQEHNDDDEHDDGTPRPTEEHND